MNEMPKEGNRKSRQRRIVVVVVVGKAASHPKVGLLLLLLHPKQASAACRLGYYTFFVRLSSAAQLATAEGLLFLLSPFRARSATPLERSLVWQEIKLLDY